MAEISEVKWSRINAGLTQAQAAAAMGVSRETFNRWENGRMPELKLARFKKVLATGTVFAPIVPDAPAAGPNKAFLWAEYARCKAQWETGGEETDEEYVAALDAFCAARDAWYLAEHGAKWLVALYEAEATEAMSQFEAPRERVVADPANWLTSHAHHAETPAYGVFLRTYGLDLQ